MSAYHPYKNDYFSHQKKKKLVSVFIPIVLALMVMILLITRPGNRVDSNAATSAEARTSPGETTGVETADTAEKPVPEQFPSGENNREEPPEVNGMADEAPLPPQPEAKPDSGFITKRTAVRTEETEGEWQSDVELERERGLAVFEDVIRQCSDTRERINQLQLEYDSTCTGTVYDAFGNPINKASTPQCVSLQNEINTLKTELRKNLQLATENARKAGVYPGQRRDILEQYDFDNF